MNRLSHGALLLLAASSCVACRASVPPLETNEGSGIQHGIRPGVFLLADEVFSDSMEDLLGAEVRPLPSGAVAITLTDEPHKYPSSTFDTAAFGPLSGVISVNHQLAHLITLTDSWRGFVFQQNTRFPDSLSGFVVHVGEPLQAVGIQTSPNLPAGRAFVRAVASAPQRQCKAMRRCEDAKRGRAVAVLVDGVGGPPGHLQIELSPENTATLQLETTLWTRVVVHVLTEPEGDGRLLWVSRRHDLLRAARSYQSLERGYERDDYPYERTTRAKLPSGLQQSEVVSAQATFIDWTAPDLDENVLSEWSAWNHFVDDLPSGSARRSIIRFDSVDSSPP